MRIQLAWTILTDSGTLTLLGILTLREVFVRLGSPIDTTSVPLTAQMPT